MGRKGVFLVLRALMIKKHFIKQTLVQASVWMGSGPYKHLHVCLLYFHSFIGCLVGSFVYSSLLSLLPSLPLSLPPFFLYNLELGSQLADCIFY